MTADQERAAVVAKGLGRLAKLALIEQCACGPEAPDELVAKGLWEPAPMPPGCNKRVYFSTTPLGLAVREHLRGGE